MNEDQDHAQQLARQEAHQEQAVELEPPIRIAIMITTTPGHHSSITITRLELRPGGCTQLQVNSDRGL
jgi:hypothetical protein